MALRPPQPASVDAEYEPIIMRSVSLPFTSSAPAM